MRPPFIYRKFYCISSPYFLNLSGIFLGIGSYIINTFSVNDLGSAFSSDDPPDDASESASSESLFGDTGASSISTSTVAAATSFSTFPRFFFSFLFTSTSLAEESLLLLSLSDELDTSVRAFLRRFRFGALSLGLFVVAGGAGLERGIVFRM